MTTTNDFDDSMLMNLIQATLAAHREPDTALPPAPSPAPHQEAIEYETNQVHWSVHQVQSMTELYQLISTLTELADESGAASAHGLRKVVIVTSDFRVNLAMNAFIRFYAQLDGMIFSARSVMEAYAIIYNVSHHPADEY